MQLYIRLRCNVTLSMNQFQLYYLTFNVTSTMHFTSAHDDLKTRCTWNESRSTIFFFFYYCFRCPADTPHVWIQFSFLFILILCKPHNMLPVFWRESKVTPTGFSSGSRRSFFSQTFSVERQSPTWRSSISPTVLRPSYCRIGLNFSTDVHI